ncbi:TIGR03621 family F420-dependent LLM class oxidoreductase [Aquihabitans daechungensis]|uniref:TIGR03621 family F420-dependent LLM class oxidoreductase n=1 Tax=Aquihabitans daechungensis TaxID=1052257 RepID=UPI003B9FD59A
MTHDRRFRFGVQTSTATSGDEWAALARQAEDLGYSTMFLPDHFGDQLAPVPAMAAAAAATTELRVGALVFDNDYKHPVVLAKEMATVDVLSGGRVELGLGAGWMISDYEQSGIPYDKPAVRVDRFEEGLAIIKGLLGPDPVTFEGTHYQVTAMDGLPKPVQQPGPPILIGGGLKRMLTLAGRHADIVGINPTIPNGAVDADAARSGLADLTDQKLEWVKAGAGDRYDDLEINLLNYACIVTDDREQVAQDFAPLFGIAPEDLLEFPHALVGTVGQICESIEANRERFDASYIVVQRDAMEAMAPVVARLTGN